MRKLDKQEQELILDFYFRCGEHHDIEKGRDLIASNPEAATLYAGLEQTLTELDELKYEPCPDNLVDLTIARLKLAASSPRPSNSRLQQLLQDQQQNPVIIPKAPKIPQQVQAPSTFKSFYLKPLFEILATAAGIALVAGMLFPGVGAMRAHSRRVACERNLSQIGSAFAGLAQDNHGKLADVKIKAGAPWWKIGDQGTESQSNTRYPFVLVKGDYVDPKVFICKGDKQATAFDYPSSETDAMFDFPSRNNLSYSFTLFCDKNSNLLEKRRKIIAGDMNPVFVPVFKKISREQSFYQKMNEFEKILLNEQLKKMMSSNHSGRGQNILYCDGSVVYIKTRQVSGDDIFTLNGVEEYSGCEVPASENDVFLAP